MGQFGKYGVVTTERKTLHPGEPVFLLRATDPNAVATILDYIERCEDLGCRREHIEECAARAERIRLWQAANPALVKERPGDPPVKIAGGVASGPGY